jgi:hypothetical protein
MSDQLLQLRLEELQATRRVEDVLRSSSACVDKLPLNQHAPDLPGHCWSRIDHLHAGSHHLLYHWPQEGIVSAAKHQRIHAFVS